MDNILRLKEIWENKGPVPQYHDFIKSNLKQNWPVLYLHIEELIKQIDNKEKIE